MDSVKHCLNKVFDKIYVIHCAENDERLKNINNQINQSGIDLDIWWTCYHPHSDMMINGMILSNNAYKIANGKELNLTREFYSIIKTSYLRGFDKILIFEDDFHLMKTEYIEEFVDNIPKDFDIIQFSILAEPFLFSIDKLEHEYENGNYFIPMEFGAWSNCGLALSRIGMKYFINFIDKKFAAADIPIYDNSNKLHIYNKLNNDNQYKLKHYIPTVPLVYLTNEFKSQVQVKEKDDSRLYQYYNHIDKNFYII